MKLSTVMDENRNSNLNENLNHCFRCGRKLVTEESKKLGFGPICYEKWKQEKHSRLKKLIKEE